VLAKHMHNVRMSTLRGGMGRLGSELTKYVKAAAGQSVTRIETDGDAYVINGEHFSDVVVAVPGSAVLLIEGLSALLSDQDIQFFRTCRYQRVVSVRVATATPVDGQCYAVSIPRVEKRSAAAISFHDYIDPSSVAAGEGLLTVSGGGADITSARLLDDVKALYRIEAQRIETMEWPAGMPMFPPGRYDEIVRFGSRRRRPGLFFCGDYLLGPLIEAAVTAGLRAADAIKF